MWRSTQKIPIPVGVKLLSPHANQLAMQSGPFSWFVSWNTLHYRDKDDVGHTVALDGELLMEEKHPVELVTWEPYESTYYDNLHNKFLCKEHKKLYEKLCEPQWCVICCKEEKEEGRLKYFFKR